MLIIVKMDLVLFSDPGAAGVLGEVSWGGTSLPFGEHCLSQDVNANVVVGRWCELLGEGWTPSRGGED